MYGKSSIEHNILLTVEPFSESDMHHSPYENVLPIHSEKDMARARSTATFSRKIKIKDQCQRYIKGTLHPDRVYMSTSDEKMKVLEKENLNVYDHNLQP